MPDHSDAELLLRLKAETDANERAARGYVWLVLAVLVGWFLVALCLQLAIRLVEVLRG